MCQKLRAAKSGKANTTSDGSIALYGQQSSDKEKKKKQKGKKGKRDLSNVTCFSCGKKGHIILHCPEKAKGDKPEEKQEEKPKLGKEPEKSEKSTSKKPPSGTLYTAMSYSAILTNEELTDTFYITSGASDHLIPSKNDLHAY
jgi:hypothetical protein